jgi:hypothetical protein
MLNDHIRLKYPMSPTHTHNNIAEKKLPHMDIPNFAAAFGKCPRSTIPKEIFLLEYLH